MMNLKKAVPEVYEENYPMDFETQTVLIEVSITNDFFLTQLTMPMVAEMDGGREVLLLFRSFIASEILALMRKGLLTEEFYQANQSILDEGEGIRADVELDTMQIFNLAYDLRYLISCYMVVMGWEEERTSKQRFPYNDKKFFTPRSLCDS